MKVLLTSPEVIFLWSLLLFSVKTQTWSEYYSNETGLDIPFSCSETKKCVTLYSCPELLKLMHQQALSVYR